MKADDKLVLGAEVATLAEEPEERLKCVLGHGLELV